MHALFEAGLAVTFIFIVCFTLYWGIPAYCQYRLNISLNESHREGHEDTPSHL